MIRFERADIFTARLKLFVFFMAMGVVFMLPYIITGTLFWGDDIIFHIARIRSLENVFFSPINFDAYEFGNSISTFYPYLTLYPCYILYAITKSISLAMILYGIIITALTGALAYYSMYKIWLNKEMAVVFSIVWIFCGYRIINLFTRFALGEFIAMTFLPLVILGLAYIWKKDEKKYYVLSLSITLIGYSHILSAYIAVVFVVLFSLVAVFFVDKRLKRVLALIKAGVLTILFTLPSTLQMFISYKHLPVRFPPTMNGNLHELYFFRYYFLGSIFIILLIVGIIRFKKLDNFSRSLLSFSLLGIVLIICILLYKKIQSFSLIGVIQFPFRLQSITSICMAFAGTVALYSFKHKNISRVASLGVVLLICFVSAAHLQHSITTTTITPNAMLTKILTQFHPPKKVDYLLQDYLNNLDINNDEISDKDRPSNRFYENDMPVSEPVDLVKAQGRSSFTYTNTQKETVALTIPYQAYIEANVLIDNNLTDYDISKYATITISIPPGEHKILLSYEYTIVSKLAVLVSIATMLLFMIYKLNILKIKRKSHNDDK